MVFFNTKEEVVEINLTPYGKHLLSKGEWKPVYYEFYDDDILYDSQYGGTADRQEEIIDRIKSTKRTKPQYTFKTPATGLGLRQEELIRKRKSLFTSFLPLGQSSLIKDKYPAITAKLRAGEVISVENSVGITGLPNNIYTITLNPQNYVMYVDYVDNISSNQTQNVEGKVYSDGSYIAKIDNEILIDITELYTDKRTDNFEISIIELDDEGNEKQFLSFIDVQTDMIIKNELLVENPDFVDFSRKLNNGLFETPDFINYFFDIKVDKEIDEKVLCKYLSKEEIARLKIVDGYDISCTPEEGSTQILTLDSIQLSNEES